MSEENKKLLLEQMRNRFQFLANADNAVEAKAGVLSGLAVAIGLGFWVEKIPNISQNIKLVEAVLGLFCLIVVIGLSLFIILKTHKYGSGVIERSRIKEKLKLSESQFLNECIIDMQQSLDHNASILKKKSKALRLVIIIFVCGIMLLALSTSPTFSI